jgi:hypothetical protein
MTRPSRFSATDLTRAIKAFEKAGLQVAGGKIGPDGTIQILTALGQAANDSRPNPLDRLHG